jgi:hypothetical protein
LTKISEQKYIIIMRKIKIGLRISRDQEISFFGLEEINNKINKGSKIISIDEGGALMQKVSEEDGNVKLQLTGFSILVTIED